MTVAFEPPGHLGAAVAPVEFVAPSRERIPLAVGVGSPAPTTGSVRIRHVDRFGATIASSPAQRNALPGLRIDGAAFAGDLVTDPRDGAVVQWFADVPGGRHLLVLTDHWRKDWCVLAAFAPLPPRGIDVVAGQTTEVTMVVERRAWITVRVPAAAGEVWTDAYVCVWQAGMEFRGEACDFDPVYAGSATLPNRPEWRGFLPPGHYLARARLGEREVEQPFAVGVADAIVEIAR